jgi:hypothetical protein
MNSPPGSELSIRRRTNAAPLGSLGRGCHGWNGVKVIYSHISGARRAIARKAA